MQVEKLTQQGKKLRETLLKEFYPAMFADKNGRPSASDISETVALLSDLSMGRYTVLPSKSNFAVSDVISASMRAKRAALVNLVIKYRIQDTIVLRIY